MNDRDREAPPSETHAHPEAHESGFSYLEHVGAEAMAERAAHPDVDEDERVATDPGQEHRAPEEQSTVHQALLDPESQAEDPAQRGAPL